MNLVLPIGLSFHTFQSLSYVIEVYRGKQKAETHFGIYSLYVMFYPQLVAGPIERPQNLLHQFYENHKLDYIRIANGLKRMTWGLFKKMVVADHLSIVVDAVYNNPTQFKGTSLIIATVFFAFQIYYDFSAYSDIALGAAQVMGFKLMENFKRPYAARSLSEFWKRWHISLSTWFKDYIYIPLGGNRVSIPRFYINLLLTFTISGLWHGASWGFLAWGFLNGLFLIIESSSKYFISKFHIKFYLHILPLQYLQRVFTFTAICFTWIFFRAHGIKNAIFIAQNCFKNIEISAQTIPQLGTGYLEFIICIVGIAAVELIEYEESKDCHEGMRAIFSKKSVVWRWSIYYLLLLAIVLFGVFGTSQFIYFQF